MTQRDGMRPQAGVRIAAHPIGSIVPLLEGAGIDVYTDQVCGIEPPTNLWRAEQDEVALIEVGDGRMFDDNVTRDDLLALIDAMGYQPATGYQMALFFATQGTAGFVRSDQNQTDVVLCLHHPPPSANAAQYLLLEAGRHGQNTSDWSGEPDWFACAPQWDDLAEEIAGQKNKILIPCVLKR